MFVKKAEKKAPVEELQEEFLKGPADETLEEIAEKMEVDKVVISPVKPDYEWVVFRNQRDPGHDLEFHHSSKTHPFKKYILIDGEKYQLPREVIKSLEGCREHIEKYRKNSQGLPEIYVAGYRTHFVCERAA